MVSKILNYLLAIWILFYVSPSTSQSIAQKKCLEYSKAVYHKEDYVGGRIFKETRSKVISECTLYDNPLIIGGKPAKLKEFPHMAAVGFGLPEEEDIAWLCGGTLISERHVLTAAHCTISRSGPPQKVKLGAVTLNDTDSYVQIKSVDKFVNHPEYKRPKKYNDIAILFLDSPVVFSPFIRPACLNSLETINYNFAKATGFGKQSFGDAEGNPVLLKVKLNIIPKDVCEKYMVFRKREMPNGLVDSMLCAGDLQGGKDTCQGDSGGPLQVVLEDPYCMYNIIGVTSFGRLCGMKYSPGLYSRVSYFVSWIESVIWA